jgi:hypothetical protein
MAYILDIQMSAGAPSTFRDNWFSSVPPSKGPNSTYYTPHQEGAPIVHTNIQTPNPPMLIQN